jgi:acetyl-CoA carboxylase biotin carboxyl carrier protein
MDIDRLEALIKLMRENGVAELELEESGQRVGLKLAGAGVPLAAAPLISAAPTATAAPTAGSAPTPPVGHLIKAPMVGTFYRAPKPGQAPYVSKGDRVQKGQPLCIVEAMKLMNELESDVSGTVLEIMVENGKPVQFGQPLIRIQPD